MSLCRRCSPILGLLAGLAAGPVLAAIVLEQPATGHRPQNRMKSIMLVPGAGMPTESGYLLQRSLAWRRHHGSDPRSGAWLVYPPAAGAVGEPSSIRELSVRNHLSRANAYRLNRFNR